GESCRIDVSPSDKEERIDFGLDIELKSFIDWVEGGDPPLLKAEDGLKAIEIVEAAYQSIATGRTVDVASKRLK
ncbi:MAG: Gfo/Idh/MocA family oxidoreductase, partial [Oricola sp.]